MKKILFPFCSKKYEFLEKKWGHRLLKIFLILILIGSFFGIKDGYTGDYGSLKGNKYTVTIVNDLKTFTENNPQYINTVPEFIKLAKELGNSSYWIKNIGCLQNETNKFIEVSEETLKGSMCNNDILKNIDAMLDSIGVYNDYTQEYREFKNKLLNMYNEDLKLGKKGDCFLNKNLNCTSDKIFIYTTNWLYQLQGIVYTLLWVCLIYLGLQFIYYKGIIYIIYGNEKKS